MPIPALSRVLFRTSQENLCLQSNTFSTTWFGINSPTLTADNGVGPTGGLASQLVFAASGFPGLAQSFTYEVGTIYTFSIWVKATTGTQTFQLAINNGSGGGALTATGNWQRFSITGLGLNNFQIQSNGSNAADVFIANAQLEKGSKVGIYVPTTTAARRVLI